MSIVTKPLALIDEQLNRLTMYRVVLFGLLTLTAASFALSLSGVLGFTSISLLALLGLLGIICTPLNYLLSKAFNVPFMMEPTAITILILYMILPPVTSVSEGLVAILAGGIAIASKYLITARGRHIFNPAAFGLAAVVIAGLSSSMWWIGSLYMLPFTALVGLLVLRKTRRFSIFATFTIVSLIILLITGMADGRSPSDIIRLAIVSGPLVFAGSIMLTEPATMPANHRYRLIFAALVGIVYAGHFSIGPISSTPETALLIGNLFALAVTPANRLTLRLVRKHRMSHNVYDYEFQEVSGKPLMFKAGQYAEITLPLTKSDNRGNRRTFTIASAPSEKLVHFGVRFHQPSSRFKIGLHDMAPGTIVHANHINGDFVLPADNSKKLAFIAGGIGITPFRAHLMDLLDRGEKRDITLLYLASSNEDISYRDVLERARDELKIKVVPIVGNGGKARLDTARIIAELPDYRERVFFVSGSNVMVDNTTELLTSTGVKRRNIRTDHFSGY